MADATPVAAAVKAAWTRWQRYRDLHCGSRVLDVAETEAQFELVATGLALSDDQADALFEDDAQAFVTLLTPLPTGSDEMETRKFHFTLVVASVLLDQYLQRVAAPEEVAATLLTGRLTRDVLLPVLQFQRYTSLHHAALEMVRTLLQLAVGSNCAKQAVINVFDQVRSLLFGRGNVACIQATHQDSEEGVVSADVSYISLCSLLELLLQQKMEEHLVKELIELSMEICISATSDWRQTPQFLRAVTVHVVPALLDGFSSQKDDAASMSKKVLDMVMGASIPLEKATSTSVFPQELLYLVCIVMPLAPRDLIADVRLQQLVCFALRHNDPLLRKQGLHVLKVAFTHCALLPNPLKKNVKANNGPKYGKNIKVPAEMWVVTWQNFLTASEVIQMHHEQHLIEQVWPQVNELLAQNLVCPLSQKHQEEGVLSDQWPMHLTFEWMQSLLVRLFDHDNPVVKRLFLTNFMESCVQAWQGWEKQSNADQVADREMSFACSPAFQDFVLVHVLRVCNDPVLFKHAHRARFQVLLATFLASFLAFQLAHSEKDDALDGFVTAIEESIFGEGAENHSPEALLSMLQVFKSPRLVDAASSLPTKMLLSATAVDRLRFLLDVHAMQSFSQAMRTKMLDALTHTLTGGFVCASSLSLFSLARVLNVFPTASLLTNDGEALLRLLAWLRPSVSIDSSSSFLPALITALRAYLMPQADGYTHSEDGLSAAQLARLLIFTAEVATDTKESGLHSERPETQGMVEVLLKTPLRELMSMTPKDKLDDSRLVLLVANLEEQVEALIGARSTISSRPRFVYTFQRKTFYGVSGEQLSCAGLFVAAMTATRQWLDKVTLVSGTSDMQSDDHLKDDIMELVTSATFVLAQLSVHSMSESGKLRNLDALDNLCDDLKNVLSATVGRTVFDLALAAKCLSIVASNAAAIDSLRAFESARIVPLLLKLDTSRRYSGKADARCAISLAASKWVLHHHVLQASSFIDTELLQATLDACVHALPTAGMDPLALIQMVQVLSLTLSQLAGPLVSGSDGFERLHSLLEEVWSAYNDSKAKPDALTRAVVMCMFQPSFLLHDGLSTTMKHWVSEFIRFGARHRPNVIFHLTCRLCQAWRAHPSSALSFANELVELLLYKEPLIDEKEQLAMDYTGPFQGFQGFTPPTDTEAQLAAITSHAKDRFVRLVVLSFLNDVAVESCASASDTQKLMDSLLSRLLSLNASPDWQKQHMLNSDGFGKKLRSWQALCIISAHATQQQVATHLPALKTAIAVPQLPSVRYYMELFGMRLATKYPLDICNGLLLPMLRDANLMPQVGASLLLVSAYLVNHGLDNNEIDLDYGEVLETMLPWLNTSHGYTRVLAQFLLAKVLPRHVHKLRLASSEVTPGLRFLEGTARFLSENKECKRMLRRQARQLEEFHPDYESSLLGMLSSGFISEFGELLPRDEALRFSEQLKTAMNELYAQYQLENFPQALVPNATEDAPTVPTSESAGGALTVQRKIDTTALLLDDSALPSVMRANFDAARRGDVLNARSRPRQPIIMCASLVDKVPNLAGLARTCEIFNAQKLVVPNLRVTEQDATFATVSATAHKWMPLEEVRPQGNDLRQALLRWKHEGYTIVAVEQTASSVSLANHTLPRKMVVVLGREKEGIPVDVLQLVDLCVEIPQFGLVRSLNVHVSGALLLWEYTQQQLLSGAIESTL